MRYFETKFLEEADGSFQDLTERPMTQNFLRNFKMTFRSFGQDR